MTARTLLLTISSTFLFVFAAQAAANDLPNQNVPSQDVPSQDLIITDQQGAKHQALLVSASADITINGLVTRTVLTQGFINPTNSFVKGQYQFPLPSSASVDSMTIKIGSRVIKGKIKEKTQAKKLFKEAQKAGKRAALVQQRRPNLFTVDVTNIAPNEQIRVELSYVDTVTYQDGEYSYNLPMTYTPRYQANTHAAPLGVQRFVSPPAPLSYGKAAVQNPIKIDIAFNPGFDTSLVTSKSHSISVTGNNATRNVRFVNQFEPMDSTFNLTWRQGNQTLTPTLLTESINGEHYAMLMIAPAADLFVHKPIAKETIFIVDSSGSMGGQSMAQAKQALTFGIKQLNEQDQFNVIEFDNDYDSIFDQPRSATDSNKRTAIDFVSNLTADGGTQMLPPVVDALSSPSNNHNAIRQVVLITDGAISNERELTQKVAQLLGDSRLFAVSIGSAPNQHLFKQMTKTGRGSFTKITRIGDVNQQMQNLFNKLAKPAMKDLELIDANGAIISIEPDQLPDVYYGEPLVVALKLSEPSPSLRLQGTLANESFSQALRVQSAPSSGIAKLWARAKVDTLTSKLHLGHGDAELIKGDIISLSMKHHFLTPYTSFVAIDQQIARDKRSPLKDANGHSLVPKGMAVPQTSLGLTLKYLAALLCLITGIAALIQANKEHRK